MEKDEAAAFISHPMLVIAASALLGAWSAISVFWHKWAG